MGLSVVIITHNESRHIQACLESVVGLADEIIVIDDHSTDDTALIAQGMGARVYLHPLESFSAQRNFGIDQCSCDWILMLDSDERMTTELADEIRNVIKLAKNDAFLVPRKNHFMGKWIRYCGWYPDSIKRLMRKGRVRYTGLVHEHLEVEGSTGELQNPFLHYTYDNLEQYLMKFNRYTTLAAETIYSQGRKVNFFHLTGRPVLEFIKMFFIKKGFLDGIYGLIISLMSAMYIFVKFAKAWLRQQEV